jgi:polysaccharide export outer membrane protein
MRKCWQYLINGLIACYIITVYSSCTNLKHVPYFTDIPDSTKEKMVKDAPYSDPVIIPDDILSITVLTIDPTTSAPVNQISVVPVVASNTSSSGPTQMVSGWLVDHDGNISLQMIGSVHVAGLTSFQAKELVKSRAEKYFKDPDVQLRFANFQITVIGEVAHPSTFVVPSEKVSILDAIGMAGDLTIYGRRENVMVIRENNGKKELYRLNLNNSDLFKSPYFYLKQNDVVYVEPNRSKAIQADAEQTRIITIAASILTGALLYLRISSK